MAHSEAPRYEIRIKGELDATWSACLDGLEVRTTSVGHTVISGPIVDQAALHGLLAIIRDLGLELLVVRRLRTSPRVGPPKGEST
jgi:hypothetical protein